MKASSLLLFSALSVAPASSFHVGANAAKYLLTTPRCSVPCLGKGVTALGVKKQRFNRREVARRAAGIKKWNDSVQEFVYTRCNPKYLKKTYAKIGEKGGLGAVETRAVYKIATRDRAKASQKFWRPTKYCAELLYKARNTEEGYARYRSILPQRLFAMLVEGWNTQLRYGVFKVTGVSFETLWKAKVETYKKNHPKATAKMVERGVAEMIRKSSTKNNVAVDTYVAFLKEKDDPKKLQLFLKVEIARAFEPIVKMVWNDCFSQYNATMYARSRPDGFPVMDKAAFEQLYATANG